MYELADARKRALEIMPLPVKLPEPSQAAPSKVPGRCTGCGCPYDQKTPACKNCAARHGMRKKYANIN